MKANHSRRAKANGRIREWRWEEKGGMKKHEILNPPRGAEKIKELKHDKCGKRLSHMNTTAKRTSECPSHVHSVSANLNIEFSFLLDSNRVKVSWIPIQIQVLIFVINPLKQF